MATWVYRCDKCEKTFVQEFQEGQTPAEKTECPYCESTEAAKVFEIPETKGGGCGCGGGSCCG